MDYEQLTKQELIHKVKLLEESITLLKLSKPSCQVPAPTISPKTRIPAPPTSSNVSTASKFNERSVQETQRVKKASKKMFNFKNYPTRKIALLITYQGWDHGGLAWQPEQTPLTTVEGELFKALLRARLVELGGDFSEDQRVPLLESESEDWRMAIDLERWGYSRAGRTDAGVSGTGQVVSLWLRSNITSATTRQQLVELGKVPCESFRDPEEPETTGDEDEDRDFTRGFHPSCSKQASDEASVAELPYVSIINSLLPDSIRVIAWSPVSPTFDARFSCHGRHYKYFFTRFEANPNQPLDIEAMQDGARRLVGQHDFRNLCKLDKSKQIENFRREIYSAEITLVDEQGLLPVGVGSVKSKLNGQIDTLNKNSMYVFDLRGSAFLYNQVRNIMAILFLIGSRLEPPNVVDGLLYTDSSATKPDGLGLLTGQFVDRKPEMAIASELPLVLWDCIYPPHTFQWQVDPLTKSNAVSPSKTMELLCTQAIKHRLKSVIALHQIHKLKSLHALVDQDNETTPSASHPSSRNLGPACQVFGAGQSQWTQNYRPILDRPRSMTYSESNQKWLESKGARKLERKAAKNL